MTCQAVRRTPRPGQPSSTRHLGLRRAGGYAGLAGAMPMLPPQRLAILGCDDAGIGPRERYLPGPPLSHADGKHVAADPLRAAAAARAHVEAFAGAIVVHFDVDAVDSAGLRYSRATIDLKKVNYSGCPCMSDDFRTTETRLPSAAGCQFSRDVDAR